MQVDYCDICKKQIRTDFMLPAIRIFDKKNALNLEICEACVKKIKDYIEYITINDIPKIG